MLRVQLLGDLAIEVDGTEFELPSSRRACALLAWFALHPGLHPRGTVAARFWPDVLDSSARASLRSAIWALRRSLGPDADKYLHAGHDRIGLDPPAELRVDVSDFAELVTAGKLEEAAELGSSGELLRGFSDDWAIDARDAHRAQLSAVFERLASDAEQRRDPVAAVAWTRRYASLDPYAEEPLRTLLIRLVAAGESGAAATAYERFRERLSRDLRLTPAPETRRLAETLRTQPAARATPRPPLPGRSMLPLIGRDAELQRLAIAWRYAQAGSGTVAIINGEPGIGKTRLALELFEHAQLSGALTASCAALDLGGQAPLGIWAELIGDLSTDLEAPPADAAWPAVLAALSPDLEPRLGRAPQTRPRAAPDLERARLFEATVALLEWAGRRPVVLLLEDVHAADAASLELIGYVARRAIRLPLLIVLTRRSLRRRAEVDALEHSLRARGLLATELTLGPLPPGDVARLVQEVAALSSERVDEVTAAADGNALLALEWAAALGRGEDEPPASLRGMVRTAMAPLTDDATALLQYAAVAARDIDRIELDALPIPSPAEAGVSALDSNLLVSERGRVGYRHALLRDAVYQEIPEPRRAQLHEVWGAALAGRGAHFAGEAARHLQQAGRDDRAVIQLAIAADHARSLGALSEAAAILSEAIALAPGDGALYVRLAEVQAWRGRGSESEEAFNQARPLLAGHDPRQQVEVWLRRTAWYRGALCHPDHVQDAAQQAVAILDSSVLDEPSLRVQALCAWAWAEAVAGDPVRADELLAEVYAIPDQQSGGDLLAHWVGVARAFALLRRGLFRESYGPLIAGGEASQRAGRPDLSYGSWSAAAVAAAALGEFDRALEFVDRCVDALRGSGLISLEVHTLAARAHILARVGRIEEAKQAADTEQTLADRLDNPVLRATSEHDAGLLCLTIGDYARAEQLLGVALEHGAKVSRPLAHLRRAEALIRLGRIDEAEDELRATALEPVRSGDMPETLVPRLTRLQGLVAAARGDRRLAIRRLNEAAEGWRRLLARQTPGEDFVASLVDFGRPPVLGLVEPVRELDQVLADLTAVPAVRS